MSDINNTKDTTGMHLDQEANPILTADEQMIQDGFDALLQDYLKSNHRRKVERITKAFNFANQAHAGVKRRSGEPYIMHPIAVARIVCREMGLGSTSICSALLHDVVEDTEYTVEDIKDMFGEKIAQIVDGLTKISGGIFGEQASAQAENFRKLLLTMSDDIRVILIKIADRLHNMRTLGSMLPAKQFKIAGETLYLYAPLAHRLGLFSIKTELEDLSFKYEHPQEYAFINLKLKSTEAARNSLFKHFAVPVDRKLKEMGLNYEMRARVKSAYSIWNKMENKGVTFEDIYDIYAVRIIFDPLPGVDEKNQCWDIYSAITDIYRIRPDRIRDWVSRPKANGYQALHLTVMGPDGQWVEIQIRSRRMDEIAEKGFAAHWKYKIGESDEESELNVWLRTIKDILDDPNPNALDFLDTLKLNLFSSEIVVFTPKGELLTLPNNSTVLDVAFNLHSQIGTKCIAGKVNHKLVPLSHKLMSGDQVEVLTSQSQKPKAEWMDFLATAKARTRLRAALRREVAPAIEAGKETLMKFLADGQVEPTNEVITKIMAFYHVQSRDAFYQKLGQGEISLDGYVLKDSPNTSPSLLKKIFRITGKSRKNAEAASAAETKPAPQKINPKEVYKLKYGAKEKNFVFSDCCHPIPGDDVMGFINDEGLVEVHTLACPRAAVLKASFGPRIVATEWETVESQSRVMIEIDGVDRHGILQELISMISSDLNIDIRSLHIDTTNEVFHAMLEVLVRDTHVASALCSRIRKIKGVQKAVRKEI